MAGNFAALAAALSKGTGPGRPQGGMAAAGANPKLNSAAMAKLAKRRGR
jgi:hypothetical protein